MINQCNVCNTLIDENRCYDSLLKDLVGLNGDYTQKICICNKCGFIFVQNPLTQKQLDEKYKNFSKYEFDNDSNSVQEVYMKRCLEQKSFIENSLDKNDFKDILEIGAASGFNLSLYKDKLVFGVEPSKWNCDNAKKCYDIEMYSGTFDEYINDFPKKTFDLIFLSHTLEHIINPSDFIKECSKINNKYFFIEVPTFDYKFMDEPFGMFTDEHVNLFTFESLQNLMNNAGYNLINAEISFFIRTLEPSGYPSIRTIWEKSSDITVHKPIISSETLFNNYIGWSQKELEAIKKKIDHIPNDVNVALWGIGNTASRILGSTNLNKKHIVRAYDSDRKKHGLLFGGVEISAFNPNDIIQKEVDVIVITTCKAQNTLIKIMEPYNNKVKIVPLFNV